MMVAPAARIAQRSSRVAAARVACAMRVPHSAYHRRRRRRGRPRAHGGVVVEDVVANVASSVVGSRGVASSRAPMGVVYAPHRAMARGAAVARASSARQGDGDGGARGSGGAIDDVSPLTGGVDDDDVARRLCAADANARARATANDADARAGERPREFGGNGRARGVRGDWGASRTALTEPADDGSRETKHRRRRARLARIVVEQWRWFVFHRGRGAVLEMRARRCREKVLSSRALGAMRDAARAARHARLRAVMYHRLRLAQRVVDVWRQEIGGDARRALEARVRRLAGHWRESAERRRRAALAARALLRDIADLHASMTRTRTAFMRWRDVHVPYARDKSAREARVARYARKTALKRAFDAWRDASLRLQNERTNMFIAKSFDDIKVLSRAMRAWRLSALSARAYEEREEVLNKVVAFRAYRISSAMSTMFAAWLDVTRAKKKMQGTPAKVRAGRTNHALYAWLFDRTKASADEEEVIDYLDEMSAPSVAHDAVVFELEDALAEYEALREEAKKTMDEARTLDGSTSSADIARRRVLEHTAEHLRRRREALLPRVQKAAQASRLASFDNAQDDNDDADADDDDDSFLRRKYF
jgi:uncharacterized protein (DUF2225 family)